MSGKLFDSNVSGQGVDVNALRALCLLARHRQDGHAAHVHPRNPSVCLRFANQCVFAQQVSCLFEENSCWGARAIKDEDPARIK